MEKKNDKLNDTTVMSLKNHANKFGGSSYSLSNISHFLVYARENYGKR